MKGIFKTLTVLLLLGMASGCSSLEPNNGLYSYETETMGTGTTAAPDDMDHDLVIPDEEIAMAGIEPSVKGFDLSRFTAMGIRFGDGLSADVAMNKQGDEDYNLYDEMAITVDNDLMAVVNVELSYYLETDVGSWQQRRMAYGNGQGYVESSFKRMMDGLYSYEMHYIDHSGSRKEVVVTFDSFNDRYTYVSESYDIAGELTYRVWQQYAFDGAGGYYFQALRHGVQDDLERASFSWFDGQRYRAYVTPTQNHIQLDGLSYDLMQGIPEDLESLIEGYQPKLYVENDQEGYIDRLLR